MLTQEASTQHDETSLAALFRQTESEEEQAVARFYQRLGAYVTADDTDTDHDGDTELFRALDGLASHCSPAEISRLFVIAAAIIPTRHFRRYLLSWCSHKKASRTLVLTAFCKKPSTPFKAIFEILCPVRRHQSAKLLLVAAAIATDREFENELLLGKLCALSKL